MGLKLPRNGELWLPAYARDRMERRRETSRPKRLWLALTDHYEPLGGGVPMPVALGRVARWTERWPEIAEAAPRDAVGRRPCYSFFYPQEEYRAELLAPLAEMARAGIGDVEVHLHHDHETAAGFRDKITTFCRQLREEHGLLHEIDGRTVFGFIHGNWALDNSRDDGRWCGLTGEIRLLRELGCYADFTMPSIPSTTQSRVINQIYWTTGPADKPRSFDQGVRATVGGGVQGEMLMISGPLGLRYGERVVPRMETGELAVYDPPSAYRVKRWLDLAPRLGDDIFLKLYSHGAREDNAGALLGTKDVEGGLSQIYRMVAAAAADRQMQVRWVSAFDMYQGVNELMMAGHTQRDLAATAAGGDVR